MIGRTPVLRLGETVRIRITAPFERFFQGEGKINALDVSHPLKPDKGLSVNVPGYGLVWAHYGEVERP